MSWQKFIGWAVIILVAVIVLLILTGMFGESRASTKSILEFFGYKVDEGHGTSVPTGEINCEGLSETACPSTKECYWGAGWRHDQCKKCDSNVKCESYGKISCAKNPCEITSKCYFVEHLLSSDSCKECDSNAKCEDYSNENCVSDPCKITGCKWYPAEKECGIYCDNGVTIFNSIEGDIILNNRAYYKNGNVEYIKFNMGSKVVLARKTKVDSTYKYEQTELREIGSCGFQAKFDFQIVDQQSFKTKIDTEIGWATEIQ